MMISNKDIIRPAIFNAFPELVVAQSTRGGGISKSPYDSLNLGSSTEDDPEHVAENKKRFCQSLGFETELVVRSHQVHSDQILLATKAGHYDGYDALVTTERNLVLAVSTADCVPIILYDPVKGVCAAVHAGWKGTVLQITKQTANYMKHQFGSNGIDVKAYIGACIGHCHFEVGAEVLANFDPSFITHTDRETGKGYVDLKAVNKAQLLEAGLSEENIEVSPYCTFEEVDMFYSHRRDKGKTGRMWSIIGKIN